MVFDFEKELKVTETNIPGLLVFDLPVHGDNRGWFKENWQRAKMTALGLPDFGPVQNNISFNATKGVTRGIHAEPWDKYISIAAGEIFGAWVDLRPGESFGQVFTTRLDPSKAIYVPRGVGNSFQALQDGTVYTYLVNAHWSLEQKKTYTFVNLADPELGIEWPIPLEESERSEADLHHPMLRDAKPMEPKRTLVTGCNGQLGRAVRAYAEAHGLRGFEYTDIDEFDFSDPTAYDKYDWSLYGTIINAGAYTAVDKAETAEGRPVAWKANAQGPALLARVAKDHHITLVHVSSDYVFDGTADLHSEDEAFAPLGVYGQTKAAGDIAVANAFQLGDRRGPQLREDDDDAVGPCREPGRPAGAGDGGGRPVRAPHVHEGHGRGDLPPAGLACPVRYVQLDRFRRGEELGADRVPRVRTDERQRGEGQADQHGRVLREREGAGQPASRAFRARPVQDQGRRLHARRLGGNPRSIREQGTRQVGQIGQTGKVCQPIPTA